MTNTPDQTNTPDPIFKHRFDSTKAGDISDVITAIHLMTERAMGMLNMMCWQFEGEERIDHNLVHSVLCSVVAEMEDIDSVLRHHRRAIRPNEAA
jgi:hypothetical protein